MTRIRTAVFPVAGRGTRFLPATKASPKEMLPIVDKPLIQYAVEEAIAAGAERLVFITGSRSAPSRTISTPTPSSSGSSTSPASTNCSSLVRDIVPPRGDLHLHAPGRAARPRPRRAVREARPSATSRSSCTWPTISSTATSGASRRCADTSSSRCERARRRDVPRDQTGSYGIVAVQAEAAARSASRHRREAQARQDAPSNLAVVGRYS